MQVQKYDNFEAVINRMTVAPATKKDYKTTWKKFTTFLKENDLEMNWPSVQAFLDYLTKTMNGRTVNKTADHLRVLIKLLPGHETNMMQYNINQEFKRIYKRVKPENAIRGDGYLTENQINDIIDRAPERVGLMIQFLFQTGCRISEMINIRLKDLTVNGNVSIKITGKGNKQRVVYIKKALYETIVKVFNSNVFLFESRLGKAYSRQGVFLNFKRVVSEFDKTVKVNPHIFRHSCAMHLQRQGASLKKISEYLGHASVSVTAEMYFHDKPGPEITDYF
jgi:site-specific recombinase XerD